MRPKCMKCQGLVVKRYEVIAGEGCDVVKCMICGWRTYRINTECRTVSLNEVKAIRGYGW